MSFNRKRVTRSTACIYWISYPYMPRSAYYIYIYFYAVLRGFAALLDGSFGAYRPLSNTSASAAFAPISELSFGAFARYRIKFSGKLFHPLSNPYYLVRYLTPTINNKTLGGCVVDRRSGIRSYDQRNNSSFPTTAHYSCTDYGRTPSSIGIRIAKAVTYRKDRRGRAIWIPRATVCLLPSRPAN